MSALLICLGRHGDVPYLRLGDVAPLVRREVVIDPEATYTELGVRSFNKGTFHRRSMKGAEFTWQGLFRINKDDLVFSNIMAWEGAVALANPKDDGCIGNHRMLTCECDKQRVDPAFLALYFKIPEGMAKLVAASTGTVARNRTLTAAALARIEVPVPSLDIQLRIVELFTLLGQKTSCVTEHLDAIEQGAEHLLALRFRDAIAEVPRRVMSEVAPAVRRSVEIDESIKYREVGARSFGKGLFVKPDFDGAEATWQKPVWIQEGDVVLSNIKAWEGAVAIAKPEHDGCIASHRYITCVPDRTSVTPGFLTYFLLSTEGLGQIGLASPGTADRNRTLGVTNLGNIRVPTPPIDLQRAFDRLHDHVANLKKKHTAIRDANATLVPATLERIFRATEAEHA